MLHSKVGDWVIPKENFLPIDSEQRGKAKKAVQITTTDALQIIAIPVTKEGAEQLKFRGVRGQFLACFFKPLHETVVAQKGGDQKQQNILSIIAAHKGQSISTEVEVEIFLDQRTYTLRGSPERMLDLRMTIVEILGPESTFRNYVTASTASDDFENALRTLITEGSRFYTALRSSWALPALSWEICP